MPLRRVLSTSWAPVIVTALFTIALLLRYDVGVLDVVVYAVYFALGISLPGVLAWRMLLAHLHTDEPDLDEADPGEVAGAEDEVGEYDDVDRPGPTWFEDLSLGTIFGFGLQLPFYLLGVAIGVPLLVVILPVAAIAVSFTALGRRTWSLPTGSVDVRAAWAMSITMIYGLAWLGRNVFSRRPLDLPLNKPPSIDETFHQALVSELANRFPPRIPFLIDTPLDYHWFVHAQIAAADHSTGVDSITMLREVMPAVSLILSVAGLGAVALRLTRRPLAAAVAPALLVMGVYQLMGPHYDTWQFLEPFMSRRFVWSPSQSYGVVMSTPALMLILEVLRPGRKAHRLTWVALVLALFALSGAKATFMPIFLCGAIAVLVLTLVFARRFDRTVAVLIGLLVVVNLFAQYVLFGGQTGGLKFDPFQTVRAAAGADNLDKTTLSITAMTLAMLTAWLLSGVGAYGLIKADRWRDPRAVWLAFCVPTGIGVGLLLYRSGFAQLWFQRTVAEMVALLSAWGLCYLLPKVNRQQAILYGGAAAASGLVVFGIASFFEDRRKVTIDSTQTTLVATVLLPLLVIAVFIVIGRVRSRERASGIVTGTTWSTSALCVCIMLGFGAMNVWSFAYDVVSDQKMRAPHYRALFAPGGTQAAEKLRDESGVHDIVATNIHCVFPDDKVCDNRNFWVSAWSERQMVIEGWGYTAATNKNYVAGEANSTIPAPDPELLKLNDAAFTDPSAETIGALVDAHDVKWLFVSKDYPADIGGLKSLDGDVLTQVYENAHYLVFKIN
jgi:hypothetical protein